MPNCFEFWPVVQMSCNRCLHCHGNWYDGGQTQHANLQEYTPEARPHPANFTAKKRQAVGAAPELVSEAGEPILCSFGSLLASPWRRLPKPLFRSQEPGFGLLPGSRLASLWRLLQSHFWEPKAFFGAASHNYIKHG